MERLRAGLEGSAEGPLLAEHVQSCSECQSRLEALATGSAELEHGLREAAGTSVIQPDSEMRAAMASLSGDGPELGGLRPAAGMIIHEYRLEEPLGEGGMGAVWRATHTRLEKTVALKLLNRRLSRQPDAVARFAREMKAIGRLEHPHIVLAMDAGDWDGVPYLVMEYVEGIDLGKLVKQHGTLEIADACEAARQAAIALQHAHENGLVHRDVKPGNLMLASDGTVKLLDLGLVRLLETEEELTAGHSDDATVVIAAELTATDMLVGTSGYMAPEQRRDPRAVDARADVFALGRTLAFLLTGSPDLPTAGKLPNGLQKILQKLQADRADDRPARAAAAATALGPWARGCDLGVFFGRPRRRSLRRLVPVLVALGVVVAATVTLAAVVPDGDQAIVESAFPTPILPEGPLPFPREVPPPGRLGMTEEDAKLFQKRWAVYLRREIVEENTIGMSLVLVPPGDVGLSDVTQVTITRPYLLSATEVTRGQFRAFVNATKHRTDAERLGGGTYQYVIIRDKANWGTRQKQSPAFNWDTPGYPGAVTENDPVTQVSWMDAVAFCDWLSQKEGKRYRLPTASESLWAARAGNHLANSGVGPLNDDQQKLEQFSWTEKNSPDRPQPVRLKPVNPWGLYDMVGNVSEWCQDWWGAVDGGALTDYQGPSTGTLRTYYGASYTGRHGYRCFAAQAPTNSMSSVGFRVLREP